MFRNIGIFDSKRQIISGGGASYPTTGLIARYTFASNGNDSYGANNMSETGSITYGDNSSPWGGDVATMVSSGTSRFSISGGWTSYMQSPKIFTYSFWFNIPSTPYYYYECFGGESLYKRFSMVYFYGSGILYGRETSGLNNIYNSYSFSDWGNWHMITIIVNQSTHTDRFYFDGNYVSEKTGLSSFEINSTTMFIGKLGSFGLFYLYEGILSDANISALYNSGIGI